MLNLTFAMGKTRIKIGLIKVNAKCPVLTCKEDFAAGV
jgi:hypothetical protein